VTSPGIHFPTFPRYLQDRILISQLIYFAQLHTVYTLNYLETFLYPAIWADTLLSDSPSYSTLSFIFASTLTYTPPSTLTLQHKNPPKMVQRIVYGISLWALTISLALTLTSILHPHWLTWKSTLGSHSITYSYGLHRKCSSLTGTCSPFPSAQDCEVTSTSFCALWRSVGFLMSFAVIVELAGLVALVVVLLGGVQQREKGWRVFVPVVGVAAAVQCAGMAIVVSC
jgi:hypothetical protein